MPGLGEYIAKIATGIERKDGDALAASLVLNSPGNNFTADELSQEAVSQHCRGAYFSNMWLKVVKSHLAVLEHCTKQDYKLAFKLQTQLLSTVNSYVKKNSDFWFISILIPMCRNVHLISMWADVSNLDWRRQRLVSGTNRFVEEAANKLHSTCFSPMLNIAIDDSRAYVGVLAAANQLLKMYQKIGYVDQYRTIVESLSDILGDTSSSLDCSRKQLVTLNYFAGKYFYSQCEFKLAVYCFTYSYKNCPSRYGKNKLRCLRYLILSKLALGYLPSVAILEKANMLEELSGIIYAIKTGHIGVFTATLEKNKLNLIRWDAYLMLMRLKVMVYRCLFKRVYLLVAEGGKLPVEYCHAALLLCGESEHTLNSVECLVEMLISGGYIKGYISHTHRKVVFSKETPFVALPMIRI